MKLILVFFVFACFLHFTCAFFWFNNYVNEPIKSLTTSTSSRRPTYPLQKPRNQQKYIVFRRLPITTPKVNTSYNRSHNTTVAQPAINKNRNPVIVQNRFPAVLYRTQQRHVPLFNDVLTQRPVNQMIFARFPSRASTRKLRTLFITMPNRRLVQRITSTAKPQNSPTDKVNLQQLLFSKRSTSISKTANMNRIDNQQRALDEFNREEQWRAFHRLWNQRTTARYPLKVNSALRK